MANKSNSAYLNSIISALIELEGVGSLSEINEIIEQRNTLPNIKSNNNWKNNVSKTIQSHCKYTKSYKGADDIFYSLYGIGKEYWGLNSHRNSFGSEFCRLEEKAITEIKNNIELTNTQKETIIDARRGQGKFRKDLINMYHKCIITNIDIPELLIASHIKPWYLSSNSERISANNGLLLSSFHLNYLKNLLIC